MVFLKSTEDINKIRESSKIVAEILALLKTKLIPGEHTLGFDDVVNEVAKKNGAVPGFLNYKGFPHSLCVSFNHEVVHGFPCPLCNMDEEDIIGLDVGILKNGFYGDAAITAAVNPDKLDIETLLLLQITEECLYKGIEQAVPGNRLGDISNAIENHATKYGFGIVKGYGGHGIGKNLHEYPHINNYGKPGTGILLKPGMTLAIEPMLTAGRADVETLDDGWTVVTKDGSYAAHFEHTIAITENGPEILSKL